MSRLPEKMKKPAVLIGLVCGAELVVLAVILSLGVGSVLGVATPTLVCIGAFVVGAGIWLLMARNSAGDREPEAPSQTG